MCIGLNERKQKGVDPLDTRWEEKMNKFYSFVLTLFSTHTQIYSNEILIEYLNILHNKKNFFIVPISELA